MYSILIIAVKVNVFTNVLLVTVMGRSAQRLIFAATG